MCILQSFFLNQAICAVSSFEELRELLSSLLREFLHGFYSTHAELANILDHLHTRNPQKPIIVL